MILVYAINSLLLNLTPNPKIVEPESSVDGAICRIFVGLATFHRWYSSSAGFFYGIVVTLRQPTSYEFIKYPG